MKIICSILFLISLNLFAEKPQINSGVEKAQKKWRDCLKSSVRVGHSIPFVKNKRKINKLAGFLGLQKNFEGADFNPKCALDTLYTWQGQWTIDFLKKNCTCLSNSRSIKGGLPFISPCMTSKKLVAFKVTLESKKLSFSKGTPNIQIKSPGFFQA